MRARGIWGIALVAAGVAGSLFATGLNGARATRPGGSGVVDDARSALVRRLAVDADEPRVRCLALLSLAHARASAAERSATLAEASADDDATVREVARATLRRESERRARYSRM